ncbi:MAG: hypothetical protein KME59_07365 [Trichormus sp. ATA11-4-KO1]|jgi:hypothetical protein|nr:hypothetical protein [Trichormus sp. ATA11-4-KO1]
MEVFQMKSTVGESGDLHIEIPTKLPPGQVSIVVILNPLVPNSVLEADYDFSDVAGKLAWQGDAVAMQRLLRDEW